MSGLTASREWKKQTMKAAGTTLSLLAVVFSGCATIQAMRRVEIDFQYVVEQAKELSSKRYRPSESAPKGLRELDYDAFRKIKFNGEESLWAKEGLPFAIQFHHLGYLYDEEIEINEFTSTHSQTIRYLRQFFDYGDLDISSSLSSSLGYAGFRVMYPIEGDEDGYHEVASFLGASYFRAVGRDMHYGASLRGLAVDAGLSAPEEFPVFRTFWLGKPLGNAKELTVFALLDSERVTGAYQFTIRPEEDLVMRVKMRLFPREPLRNVGIAPITSMFWRGENRAQLQMDYRPEVHDSDGLMIAKEDGEWIWRPLDLGKTTRLSYLSGKSLRGFGLLQRDREFEHYQDLEAHYHKRPSVWVEPIGDWGPGVTRLIELPTNDEFSDNIVALWEPGESLVPGRSYDYEYMMRWTKDSLPSGHPRISVTSTRMGRDVARPDLRRIVVEFRDDREGEIRGPDDPPEVEASVGGGASLVESAVVWNPYAETWRVSLLLSLDGTDTQVVEMKCRLLFPEAISSEVWTYQWSL